MRNLNRLVKCAVLAAVALALWACSSSNGGAPAFNAQGSHPDGWLQLHPVNFINNPDQCKECHGSPTDTKGGISRVSCASASWKGIGCHAGGPGHPAGFADPDAHGARAKAKAENTSGFAYCQVCHGHDFTGGKVVPGFTATSCVDTCHGVGGFPHSPPPWLAIDPTSPSPFRTHTTTDESNANVCYQCHAGAVTSTPGCFNNTMCHAAMDCATCHSNGSGPDVEFFAGQFWNSGNPGRINMVGEWDTTGHGRPSNTTYTSGNPGAGFNFAKGCEFCHDTSIGHKKASNPFRLRNNADSLWGKNGVCMNCHASGSGGITVAGVLKNSSLKINAYHYGEAHTSTLNGGQFCWDCHDGHGDNNSFMIHKNVAPTSDPTTGAPLSQSIDVSFTTFNTGLDYAKSSAPFNGICNVCHTPGQLDHYTNASGDGHNAGIRCTNCHTHNSDAINTGFKPPAGSGGDHHAFPFPGSAHMAVASGSCLVCHTDGTTIGVYPVPIGLPPDCRGCHIKADPLSTAGCGSCHGPLGGNGRPNGSTFPDIAASHNSPGDHAQICSTCHGTNGSGQSAHGPSNRTGHGDANVIVQFTGPLSNGTAPFSFIREGNGHGRCSGTCHVTAQEVHKDRRW